MKKAIPESSGSLDLDAETRRRGVNPSENSGLPPRLCVSASKILASAILIILTAGAPFAAETAEQRGKRVVDEAIAALGGDAFLRVQDRVESGRAYSFYNGRISGLSIAAIYTRYLSHPGAPVIGRLEVEEKEAFGREENSGFALFTDKPEGWDVTFRGARSMDDERLASYADNTLHNIFYMLRKRMGEPGFSYYSKGSDLYENRPVNIVDITGGDGNPIVNSYRNGDTNANIGYPALPSEIDWYIEMLKRAAPSLSQNDLAATRAAGRAHADLRHPGNPRPGAGPAQRTGVAARHPAHLRTPVQMCIDVHDVDGLADDVQGVEHRDGDPVIPADHKDLRSLAPQLPQRPGDKSREAIVAAADPGEVSAVHATQRG